MEEVHAAGRRVTAEDEEKKATLAQKILGKVYEALEKYFKVNSNSTRADSLTFLSSSFLRSRSGIIRLDETHGTLFSKEA